MRVIRAACSFESLFLLEELYGGVSILERSLVCTPQCSPLTQSEHSATHVPLPVYALG